jgi:hypothetical protein
MQTDNQKLSLILMNYEFGKLGNEETTREESHIEEDWKQLKEVTTEAAEQTKDTNQNQTGEDGLTNVEGH